MTEGGPITEQPLAQRDAATSAGNGDVPGSRVLATRIEPGPAAPPGAQRSPFTPRLLLQYKWTILLGFIVTLVGSQAVIWLGLTPQYTAEALLEIRSRVPHVIVETSDRGVMPGYESYRGSQVQIMQSSTVLRRVLDRPKVRETEWFHQPASLLDQLLLKPTEQLERLRAALEVLPIKNSEVIRITVTADSPDDAQLLANGVLEEYIAFSRESLSDDDKLIYAQVQEAKEKLETEISYSERAVSDARKALRTGAPDELIERRRLRLDDLETKLKNVELELALKQQELASLAEAAPASQPAGEGAYAYGDYADDALWQGLHMDYRRAQEDLARDEQRFGPRSDQYRRREHALKWAEQNLQERQDYLDRTAGLDVTAAGDAAARGAGTGALQREIKELQLKADVLRRELQETDVGFNSDFNAAEALLQETDDLETNREELRRVDRRLAELDEKRKVPATIQTISPALKPSQPAKDRRFKLAIAAVFGALAAGVGLAALRVKFNPQVQRLEEVSGTVGSALLGRLPLHDPRDADGVEGSGLLAEAVRVVRTALINRLEGTGAQVIQVTSAGVGSGKSTVALLLGRSLAQCGHKVLLVDADLYRPSLAKRFALPAAPGLIDVLHDPARAAAAPRATGLPNLGLITSGAAVADGEAEALANGVFADALARWCRDYEFVLLDTPPLLVRADAAIIARQAHGTVFVVRERHCHLTEVLEALEILGATGGRLAGTVFVGASGGPRSRYENYYYGYGNGHAAPAAAGAPEPAATSADGEP